MFRPWENSSKNPNSVATLATVPATVNKRRKHLSVDAKQIVKNVFQCLVRRGLQVQAARRETSDLTQVPVATIKKITLQRSLIKRKIRKDFKSYHCVDESDKDLIRRTVYSMYEDQLVPTLNSLKLRLQKNDTNICCSRATLQKILKSMGFTYRNINKRQILMESLRLRNWRFEYLQQIKQYRVEKRPIIYLDETWYDTHDTVSRGWVDLSTKCQTKAPSNKGKRITILHAGSENGWIPNCLLLSAKNIKDSNLDYHEDTTAELFENWFKDVLLPNLQENSVIVMDNASYHSRLLNKVPNNSNTKLEIQDYMLENDIYFEFNYKKVDLLKVLSDFHIEKEYVCDNMAKSMGHTVLRLPPYYCIFNPIEHIWRQLKSEVRTQNITPTLNSEVIKLIQKSVESISKESWQKSIKHVIKIEDSYMFINVNVEPIIINLDNSSDSETEFDIS